MRLAVRTLAQMHFRCGLSPALPLLPFKFGLFKDQEEYLIQKLLQRKKAWVKKSPCSYKVKAPNALSQE